MTTREGFTLFDTAIGLCAIAWGPGGVAGVQLPEATELATRARMRARFPNAREEAPPPPEVRRAIAAIVGLLRGEPNDLSAVALDLGGVPPFHRLVYEAARAIPPGETISYGELAARAGAPGAARAVGQALGRNPFAIVVPCHRVLAAGGRPGGFSSEGGLTTKLRMLAIEGAAAVEGLLASEGAAAAEGLPASKGAAAGGGRGPSRDRSARAAGGRAKVPADEPARPPRRAGGRGRPALRRAR
ncbi:MAG TPA: methylated-DNA--[protein]-cysteine S-methyltransferase [Polyangiaceae bacterium]|nr:methylated-DNA--[protein]-cysteine S-methyltransferase [Polyangiaceae bacterium]